MFKDIYFFICVYIDWLVQIYVLIGTESAFCLGFYWIFVVCGFYWGFSSYYWVSGYFWRLSNTSSWVFISSFIYWTSFSYFTNINFFFGWVYCWDFGNTWSSNSGLHNRLFIYRLSIRLISRNRLLISIGLLVCSSMLLITTWLLVCGIFNGFLISILILVSSILDRLLVSLFNPSNSKRFLFDISNRRICPLNVSRRSISDISGGNWNFFNSLVQILNSSILAIIIIELILGLIQSLCQFSNLLF